NIDILRKGQRQTLHVMVARMEDASASAKPSAPAPKPAGAKFADLGLTLAALDNDARNRYHIGGDVQGVVVTDVNPDSPAGDRNLRPGDVIVEVQNQPVKTPDDVTRRVQADIRAGRKVELLLVNRGGDLTFVALRLAQS